MFWFVILLVMLGVVGVSVLVGTMINRRGRSAEQRRQLHMAKASGAFQHRKSNQ